MDHVTFVVPKRTPGVLELVSFVDSACYAARMVTGARVVAMFGEQFTIPSVTDAAEGFMFVKLAGKRACVLWVFDDQPAWLARVNTFGDFPPMSLDAKLPYETYMRWHPESDPAATVASLVLYIETLLETFVAEHPDEASAFPELDDAAVARIFQ